jgi:hypothetical protein
VTWHQPNCARDEARRIAANIAKQPVIAAAVALSVFAGGTAGSRLPLLMCSAPSIAANIAKLPESIPYRPSLTSIKSLCRQNRLTVLRPSIAIVRWAEEKTP